MFKKMMLVLVVLFLTTGFANAAPDIKSLLAEKENISKLMGILEDAFNENEAKRAKLERRASDLDWSAGVVKKEIDKWNAANAQLQAKIDSHAAAIADHNSRCGGTYESQSYVDSCNNNASRLNAYSATLDKEAAYNDQQRSSVEEMIRTQEAEERKLDKEINAYNKERSEIIEAGVKMQKRLKEIEAQLDPCREAVRAYDASPDPMVDGSMERMKAVCGNLFDGN